MLIKFLKIFSIGFLMFTAQSDEPLKYEIQIKDHKFIPKIIEAPAGKVIKLKVTNLDATVEEFESDDLKREKIVPGNGGSIVVTVGPLKPGRYIFFGEFHMDTAQGELIVK